MDAMCAFLHGQSVHPFVGEDLKNVLQLRHLLVHCGRCVLLPPGNIFENSLFETISFNL